MVAAPAAHTELSDDRASGCPASRFSHAPSFSLLRKAVEHGESPARRIHVGPLFTTDSFYSPDPSSSTVLCAHGTIGIDMEAAALYAGGPAKGSSRP